MSRCAQQSCPGTLLRDGQSQKQRLLPALDPNSAPVDGRDLQQWLDFAVQYAGLLNFINPQTNQIDGNWRLFLPNYRPSWLASWPSMSIWMRLKPALPRRGICRRTSGC